jgi:hypothetical protein
MLIVSSLYSSTHLFDPMTAHVMQVFPKHHPYGLYARITNYVSIINLNHSTLLML